jgi:hypothetical protein
VTARHSLSAFDWGWTQSLPKDSKDQATHTDHIYTQAG